MERRDSLVCIVTASLTPIERIMSFISVGTSILLLRFALAVSETLIRVGEVLRWEGYQGGNGSCVHIVDAFSVRIRVIT